MGFKPTHSSLADFTGIPRQKAAPRSKYDPLIQEVLAMPIGEGSFVELPDGMAAARCNNVLRRIVERRGKKSALAIVKRGSRIGVFHIAEVA